MIDSAHLAGKPAWINLSADRRPGSNLLAATVADTDRLTAFTWSGTSWGNEPASPLETQLDYVSIAEGGVDTHGGVDVVAITHESISGDVMVAWGSASGNHGTSGARYATCTGGTSNCAWSSAITPPTFTDDATTVDIASNPYSDEIVFASIGADGSVLQIGYWSGSAWTNTANADSTAGTVRNRYQTVAVEWLRNQGTDRSVVIYRDGGDNNIGWFIGNGATFTKETDFVPSPGLLSIQGIYVEQDPWNHNKFMLLVTDATLNGYAKTASMDSGGTITWSNADGGNSLRTGTAADSIDRPMAFAYWRNGAGADVSLGAIIKPWLSFDVSGRTTACNSEPNFNSSSGSGNSVSLGNITGSATTSGGQNLSVSSNAGTGFSVFVRGMSAYGNLRNAGHSWVDVTGTNASPGALGVGERFGYTFHDSSSPTLVTNPGPSLFAALTNNPDVVMESSRSNGTGCVSYTVQSASETPAGSYSASVIYSAIANF